VNDKNFFIIYCKNLCLRPRRISEVILTLITYQIFRMSSSMEIETDEYQRYEPENIANTVTYNRLSYSHKIHTEEPTSSWTQVPLDSLFCSFISFDRKGHFVALFLNDTIIELWDARSTLVPITLLTFPETSLLQMSGPGKRISTLRQCQQLVWAYDG
jgi:hypothetical protein